MPTALAPVKSDSSTTGLHIPALDGLRGLAILAVLMAHLFWSNNHPEGGALVLFFAQAREAGWVGVQLFFVLSGFLITGILYDTLLDQHFFRNFYARRTLRIFPLYYGVLALLLIVTRLRGEHWSSALNGYLTYTENLRLTHLAPTTAYWVNINHFWSLMVEEQFYLFWPMVVFLLRSRRRIAVAALIGALLSFTVRIILAVGGTSALFPYLAYSWTPACLDGLFVGGLLAMAVRSNYRNRILDLAMPVLLACSLIIAMLWYMNDGLAPVGNAGISTFGVLALVIGFAALLAGSLRPRSRVQSVLSAGPVRFLGRYSYGLYIYHGTIGELVATQLRPMLLSRTHSKGISVIVPGLLAFALSIGVAWVSYNFYEQRFLVLKRYFEDHSRRPKLQQILSQRGT